MNLDPAPRQITLRVTQDQPACPHCAAPALLAADVPHGWANPDGTTTSGTITVLLCPHCDTSKPGAAPLITYFTVHGQVDAQTISECAALIQAWVDSITIPPIDLARLEEEIRAWQQGDL
jgi:hypothetical protein